MSRKIGDNIKKIESTYIFYLAPIFIFFGLMTTIFIIFELSIFTIVRQVNELNALVGIWFWEIGALTFYGSSIYLAIRIHSDRSRKIISVFLLFLSILAALTIVVLSLILGLILLKLTIGSIGILSFIAFLMMVVEEPPELMDNDITNRGIFIRIVVIVILLTLNTSLLFYRPNNTIVQPKSSPELIFWSKPEDLPDRTDILNLFNKNNFSFCIAIAAADVDNADTTSKIKMLLNYQINVYIMLVPTIGTYTTLENAYTIKNLYLEVRSWLLNENLFNESGIKAFLIDAESSETFAKETADLNPIEIINYLTLNLPNESIIVNASKSLIDFTNKVHSDGKLHGIIKSPTFFDASDGDHDLGYLFHNVYGIPITWDFSVNMLYRTEVAGGQVIIGNTSFFSDLYNNIFNFYGTIEENKFNVISKHFFYINVAALQSGGEVLANERYVFIGDTQDIFAKTSYIENEEIYDDLDICRHFNEEKVFIFLYSGFWQHYGEEGLNKLAAHCKQTESWVLPVGANEKNVIPIYYAIVNVFDRFTALGFDSLY